MLALDCSRLWIDRYSENVLNGVSAQNSIGRRFKENQARRDYSYSVATVDHRILRRRILQWENCSMEILFCICKIQLFKQGCPHMKILHFLRKELKIFQYKLQFNWRLFMLTSFMKFIQHNIFRTSQEMTHNFSNRSFLQGIQKITFGNGPQANCRIWGSEHSIQVC